MKTETANALNDIAKRLAVVPFQSFTIKTIGGQEHDVTDPKDVWLPERRPDTVIVIDGPTYIIYVDEIEEIYESRKNVSYFAAAS
jgi:hypothetical protein